MMIFFRTLMTLMTRIYADNKNGDINKIRDNQRYPCYPRSKICPIANWRERTSKDCGQPNSPSFGGGWGEVIKKRLS